MGAFRTYMAALAVARTAGGERPRMDERALDELLRRYEWFTAARMVRAVQRGEQDERLILTASSRGAGLLALQPVDAAALTGLTPEDWIDRFLREDDLRIVIRDDAPDRDVRTEAELAEEDDVVTEELAEIYLAQGLRDEALGIYRKLSLRNPEKSVYFAKIIERIETNN